MINADLHVHSKFSIDSQAEMHDICKKAISLGLKYIAFTDHFDMNPNDHGYQFFNYDRFSKAIDEVRQEFEGDLTVIKGVEFSEPHLYPEALRKLHSLDFDIFLGSVHFIGPDFIGERDLRQKMTVEEINRRYYEEVLKAVEFGEFDVLAHLDFPKRYLKQELVNEELIQEIIQKLIKKNIALELNTSTIRKGLGETSPGIGILVKYLSAGGRRITVGSDAHTPADIGAGFDHVFAILNWLKVETIGVFQKHHYLPVQL